jgi:hypothetical protein
MALAIGKIPGLSKHRPHRSAPHQAPWPSALPLQSYLPRNPEVLIYDHRCDVPAPDGSNLGERRGGLDGDRAVQFGYSPVI